MRDELRGEASSRSAGRAAQRVLLVERCPVLGHVLQAFLAKHFAVVGLATGIADLSRIGAELGHYDVVIVDDDGGPEAVRAYVSALSCQRGSAPRIVLLSGGAHCVAYGPTVRRTLLKPVPGSALLEAVDRCLGPGLRRAQRARKAAIRHRSG
jgi:DNA-binding response OmpR family regulator